MNYGSISRMGRIFYIGLTPEKVLILDTRGMKNSKYFKIFIYLLRVGISVNLAKQCFRIVLGFICRLGQFNEMNAITKIKNI